MGRKCDSTRERKYRIMWFKSLDSTNLEARRRMSELDSLSVLAAEMQTAGRGQGDHVWESEAGMNLTFSLILKYGNDDAADGTVFPAIPAREQGCINEVVTSALVELLGKHGIEARIKLPNDIYVGEKKICGMLIEHSVRGDMLMNTIIGIGLNVNQTDFPAHLPNPVSMKQLTSRQYELEALLSEVILNMIRHLLHGGDDGGGVGGFEHSTACH